ncbi:MAG: OmpH family outer membrane protein [Verrucomicrobiota bacterium]
MKNMKTLWVSLTLLIGLAAANAQSPKIVGIEFQKLFNGYWKTAQATNKLQIQFNDIERERTAIRQQFKKAEDEYKTLQESANDQAISAEQRDKRKKLAEEKLGELRQIEAAFQQFNQNAEVNYRETQDRMVRNIVKELREAVTAKAKGANYSLVVNLSVDAILYSSMEDITDVLLKDINAKAPPGAFEIKPAAETKPDVKEEKK